MKAIYLHGFASSPESSKAIRIAGALGAEGVPTEIPDLNQPEFRSLTVTRMIDSVRASLDDYTVLIGSSLGAFVAVHTAAADDRVKGLVLLAPALDFGTNDRDTIGTVSVVEWRNAGQAEVFHYAWNRPEMLGYGLYEDAQRYDSYALSLDIPVLIFQGSRDTVVDPVSVKRWSWNRKNVRLEIVDDDHQLHGALPSIIKETAAFVRSLRPTG